MKILKEGCSAAGTALFSMPGGHWNPQATLRVFDRTGTRR